MVLNPRIGVAILDIVVIDFLELLTERLVGFPVPRLAILVAICDPFALAALGKLIIGLKEAVRAH
jgi:hypothetical protein